VGFDHFANQHHRIIALLAVAAALPIDSLTVMTSISILEAACAGLLMPSESDYPLETFVWPTTPTTGGGDASVLPMSATQLRQRIGQDEDTLVEATTLDDLFANIAAEQDWHDDVQRQQVVRFQALLCYCTDPYTKVCELFDKDMDWIPGNPIIFVAGPGDTGSLHGVDSPSGGLVDKASSRNSNNLNVV
jgi:Nuclease A inhibitor-like protein